MSDQRPTTVITTPGGIEVEHYEYMNGGDSREYQKMFTRKMSAADLMNAAGNSEVAKNEAMAKIEADLIFDSQELLVKQLVVRVGDKKATGQQALDLVLNMRPEDTQFVIDQLDRLSSGSEKKSEDQSVNTSQEE